MQKGTSVGKEVKRALERVCHGIVRVMIVSQAQEPGGDIEVADTSRNFLDVRLEMKDRLAELFMAAFRSLRERTDDRLALAANETRNRFFREASEEVAIAGQKARVKKRDRELDVFRVKTIAFRKSARGRAQLQPHI